MLSCLSFGAVFVLTLYKYIVNRTNIVRIYTVYLPIRAQAVTAARSLNEMF